MNITVGIAEDHAMVRKGICELVNSFEGIEMIIEAENGQKLLDKIARSNVPDVVLIDLEMPVLNGSETIKRLKEKYLNIKIIILTMHESNHFIVNSLKLGANAYLLKDDEPEELQKAILEVTKKGQYFTERTLKVLTEYIAKENKPQEKKIDIILTEREQEVLNLTCKGFTSREIGNQLFIAKKTVEGHQSSLLEKLDAKNKTVMIIHAIRLGIINVNEI